MRIERHRLNNRIANAAVMLVLCILLVGLIPLQTVFAAGIEVDLPYEQTWSNNSGKAVNNTFRYELTAADAKSPAPDEASGGSYILKLTGSEKGQKTLHFSFSKPGYYHYSIKPLVTGLPDPYSYDPPDYYLMIMVVNGDSGLEVGAVTIQDKDLAKYPALVYEASYTVIKPDPDDPDPGGGGGPGGGAAGGGGVAQGGTITGTTIDDPEPPTTITDPEPPKSILPEVDDWALFNLILMVLTVIIALADGILYFKKPTDKYGEEYDDEDEEIKRHGTARILAIITAILAIVLFFLTEDITLPMVWVDEYTLWQLLLFVATAILTMLSKKETNEEEEQTQTG